LLKKEFDRPGDILAKRLYIVGGIFFKTCCNAGFVLLELACA